jgi:uncharacterized damage-inducible protein DinB
MKTQSSNPAIDQQTLQCLRAIQKPTDSEYPPYAHIYIDLLPDDGLILQHLAENLEATRNLVASLPEARLLHRYAPGKWTIKEILTHLIDDERIYVYRALRFARNDSAELSGFDQDHYALHSGANQRTIDDLLDEFSLVRRSTIAFFNSLDAASLLRSGIADGKRASVRALAYHIAGHEIRHLNVIRERYLGKDRAEA